MTEIVRGLDAFRIVLRILVVTITAQLPGAGRQHRVMRFRDCVIAVALAALGPVVLIESLFVFAAVEQTGVG